MHQRSPASWLLLLFLTLAAASVIDSSTVVRVPEGGSEAEVVQAVRSEVSKAALLPRGTKKSSTTLDRSWTDATLLQLYVITNTIWKASLTCFQWIQRCTQWQNQRYDVQRWDFYCLQRLLYQRHGSYRVELSG